MVENNVYSAPESDLGVQEGDMLASRWARLGGTIVDAIAVMAIAGPVMYFSGFWDRAMSGSVSTLETIAYGLLGMAIYLILNGYFLAKHGQTVGKKVVGTRIVSNETNEIIPLWKVFFVRYLPMAIGGNIPVIGQLIVILDSVFIFRKDKRCIHDLICSTKVIKANAG